MVYGKYRLIDLFCGCGGMTQGFAETGKYISVFANDWNSDAIDSYRANFDCSGKHSFPGDIVNLVDDPGFSFPKADVVIGGPPCQGFSLLNKQRLDDPRRALWYQFMRVVEASEAQVIVMENVRQLLTSPEFLQIKDTLHDFGFEHVEARVLLAADYGVAEMRYRTIIMASRANPISLPRPTHCDPKLVSQLRQQSDFFGKRTLKSWSTVHDVIADLPPPLGTEIRPDHPPLDLHFGRNPTPVSVKRYRAIPAGGNRFDLQKNRPDLTPGCWIRKTSGGTDLMGRLWWDRPSVTIRTEFFKPEKGRYLHPDQDRPITHREAARIQSFPDNFAFRGSKIEIARQIGNAVPPRMAKAIARQVTSCLEGRTTPSYVAETRAAYEVMKNGKIP
ncbi:MAG: DNA cytosine methyltransferase [Opitutaceae bacterium]